MSKASIMAGLCAAIVASELVGWAMGLGPLAAAKAVMLGALVCFNCLKLNESASSHDGRRQRPGGAVDGARGGHRASAAPFDAAPGGKGRLVA